MVLNWQIIVTDTEQGFFFIMIDIPFQIIASITYISLMITVITYPGTMLHVL